MPRKRHVLVLEDWPNWHGSIRSALPSHHLSFAEYKTHADQLVSQRVRGLEQRLRAIERALRRGNLPEAKRLRYQGRAKRLRYAIRHRPFDAVVIDLEVPMNVRQRDDITRLTASLEKGGRLKPVDVKFLEEETANLYRNNGLVLAKSLHRNFAGMPLLLHTGYKVDSEPYRQATDFAKGSNRVFLVRKEGSLARLADRVNLLSRKVFKRPK